MISACWRYHEWRIVIRHDGNQQDLRVIVRTLRLNSELIAWNRRVKHVLQPVDSGHVWCSHICIRVGWHGLLHTGIELVYFRYWKGQLLLWRILTVALSVFLFGLYDPLSKDRITFPD